MRSCCKIFPNTSNYKVAVLIYSFHCDGYKLGLLYKEAGHLCHSVPAQIPSAAQRDTPARPGPAP